MLSRRQLVQGDPRGYTSHLTFLRLQLRQAILARFLPTRFGSSMVSSWGGASSGGESIEFAASLLAIATCERSRDSMMPRSSVKGEQPERRK